MALLHLITVPAVARDCVRYRHMIYIHMLSRRADDYLYLFIFYLNEATSSHFYLGGFQYISIVLQRQLRNWLKRRGQCVSVCVTNRAAQKSSLFFSVIIVVPFKNEKNNTSSTKVVALVFILFAFQ